MIRCFFPGVSPGGRGESAVHKVKVIAFPFLAFLFTTHIGGSCKLASYLVNLINISRIKGAFIESI